MAPGSADIPIQTARLLLRDFETADWEAVQAYACRPEVVRFMPWGPNDEQDSRDYVSRAMAGAAAETRDNFELAVVDRADGCLVGGAGLSVRSQLHRQGFLGYCLHSEVWGRGYATEAAAALVPFGFEQLGLHRITATCDVDNAASARVLEKVGMQREGRLRDDVCLRGEWRDHYVYGILVDEWRDR